jgi:chemotaxis protein CheX
MQVKYVNPFVVASVRLFREYLGVQLSHEPPYVNPEPQDLLEVSGIIGLAGETVGAVVLSFDTPTAIAVVSKLAGKSYRALSNEVIDGVGELVNIIAGNAKKDLLDFRLSISLPGVITGRQYRIKWPDGVPVVTIPFSSSLGAFWVSVSLKDIER